MTIREKVDELCARAGVTREDVEAGITLREIEQRIADRERFSRAPTMIPTGDR